MLKVSLRENIKGVFKISRNRKIQYLNVLPVVTIAFILYKLIDNVGALANGFKFLGSILSPFFWAFGIAYFLNPQMKYFEQKFKMKRVFSLITVYIIFLGIMAFTIGIIVPSLYDNVKQIVVEIPDYAIETEKFINQNIEKFNIIEDENATSHIQDNLTKFVEKSGKYIESWFTLAVTKIIDFTSGFFKFIIGIIISVYMLSDKEKLILGTKRIMYASLGNERGDVLVNLGREVDAIFSKYIIGKFIDSVIIGVLCIILLTAIKTPYALLISIIVGITNMIPYFGPFIGMAFGGIIVVFSNPIMALWVVIVVFLLQQFDGWYLGPKILGDKVGLSPLFIIFSVIVGGGLFGVLGMFLGVPFIATIKLFLDRMVDKKLEQNEEAAVQ